MRSLTRRLLALTAAIALVTAAPAAATDELSEPAPNPRVIGGDAAEQGEFPHVVSLGGNGGSAFFGHFCGGVLIDPEWVLTAAHCIDQPGEMLDAADILATIDRADLRTAAGERIGIAEIHLHPDFDRASLRFDAALLELVTPAATIPITPMEAIGLLPESGQIFGWGDTTNGSNQLPAVLQHATVPLIDDADCATAMGASFDAATMLCAGNLLEGGVDSCGGDSGGPLTVEAGGQTVVAGIVSWGFECGQPGFPGVYTEVAAIRGWIDQFIPPVVYPVGLFDASQGLWYLEGSPGFFFGNPGDTPFVGDWDCDGIDTPGLYRQSDGFVYLRDSNTPGIADRTFFFGNPEDVPVAGDFNGDGCDTVSIYRPSEQRFYIVNALGANGGGLGQADFSFTFGNPGDRPFTGDFDGNGVDDVALYRPSAGFVYMRYTPTTGVADNQFFFGDPGDGFVAGDWNQDGSDSPAVFRPSNGTFYFRFSNTQGVADAAWTWGEGSWIPVAGAFTLDE